MEISELAWRLIILFIPGILCTALLDTLVVHKPWGAMEFFVRAFIFGMLTYFVFQAFVSTADYVTCLCKRIEFSPRYLVIWDLLADPKARIKYEEVLYSSLVSIVVAFVSSWAINKKLITKLGQRLGVTSKFGDEDVWSFFLNSNEVGWVWVRFPKQNLVYEGWVQSFSDAENLREIVLEEVRVYTNSNSESLLLYEVPTAYLSGSPTEFIIERPPKSQNQTDSQINRR